jgi:hypothetical protein
LEFCVREEEIVKNEIMKDRLLRPGWIRPTSLTAGAGVVLWLMVTVVATAQTGSRSASERALPNTVQSGSQSTVEMPREVDMSTLPAMTEKELSTFQEAYGPLDGLTDAERATRKQLARERAAAGLVGGKSSLLGRVRPEDLPTNEIGFAPTILPISPRFGAHQEGGGDGDPPDMSLAVSENYAVQLVNNSFSVYDKAGKIQAGFPKSAGSFFGLAGGTYTTDPRGFYDWVNQRFVFIMLTESNPFGPGGTANVGGLLIAASQTSNPTGKWNVYGPAFSIGKKGECPDYPTLGQDSNNWGKNATKGGIYVGINEFGTTGYCKAGPNNPAPTFIGNYFFIIPKDALYAGTGFSDWIFSGFNHGGTLVDTMQAANMTDFADRSSSVPILNTLNMNFGGPNGMVAWSVSNPFGFLNGGASPAVTGVNVNTGNYSFPPDADEPNGSGGVCGGCINTGDNRISGQVKYHAGELFGAFNTAASGSSVPSFIWFDVHMMLDALGNATAAYERQEDCVFCGLPNGHNAAWFYATLQPDLENNLLIAFDFSADISFPSVGYSTRRVNHPDGQLAAINNSIFTGVAFYQQGCTSGQGCRWGDYTATAPDLTVRGHPAMWFSAQYAHKSGNWGTAIVAGKYLRPTDQ